jgi:hypothetical protein
MKLREKAPLFDWEQQEESMKLIIALLAAGLIGVSPAAAQDAQPAPAPAPAQTTSTTQSTTTTTTHKPVRHHKKAVRHHRRRHVVRHTHKTTVHATVKTSTKG